MLRRSLPLLLACAVAAVATACGGGEETADTRTPGGTATAPAADAPEPVGDWSWETVASDDFPREDGFAYLVDVRASTHDASAGSPAFDRVVLELEGDPGPSWRVAPEDPPIVEDPSGRTVEVAGDAFVRVTLHPASGRDATGDEAVLRYEGPDRIGVGGRVVTELVQVTDHHGALAWVIGLARQAPFAVALLDDPPRLVVDVVEESG